MYFNRIGHPANFAFASSADAQSLSLDGESLPVAIDPLGADVHRVTIAHARWPHHGSQAELARRIPGPNAHTVALTPDGALAVTEKASGRVVLSGLPAATFGACGEAWMFQFRHAAGMQFYGLGEHSGRLEKSGQRVKFWNTDLFGDFAHCEIRHGHANPMYVAIPWLIVKQDNHYIGLLVHHPGAVFMDLASNFVWNAKNREDIERGSFYLGAPDGRPELYVIIGPTLPELTRKLQALVGQTPLPPLWALGHHQSRFGYGGPRDLARLDAGFRQHDIPCDGLWLDIDYMERYKVFTFASALWKDEAATRAVLASLAKRGRRVVPILDPGVKVEPGYAICDEGLRAGLFCLNPHGRPFVGFVWPGKTYFPDFSLPEARKWWAGHVRQIMELGIGGTWIDMNDPAVGAVDIDGMRFARGTQPHGGYHNQYALGMAQATRAGQLAARPDERPFLLTRSAYLSSSRFAAVWTGDNVSNWHHLRQCIPISVGLALSGLPFNGADVCGFMDDTNPALALAWYKTCFLFPFLRNHSSCDTRAQEPWTLGVASRPIAHYIRLRYKLLPYLYQLFVAQEERGEALLRPLFHDFADTPELPLGNIDDQFLIGPAILQAPIVEERRTARRVVLPGPARWFSAQDGRWFDGGRSVRVQAGAAETPLYVREGAIVPMQPGERTDNRNDLATVELHCFLRRDSTTPAVLHYACDDGATFAYRRGARTTFTVTATVQPGGTLRVAIDDLIAGYRVPRVRVFVYEAFAGVTLALGGRDRALPLERHRWKFTGRMLAAKATGWVKLAWPRSPKK